MRGSRNTTEMQKSLSSQKQEEDFRAEELKMKGSHKLEGTKRGRGSCSTSKGGKRIIPHGKG